VGLVIYIVDLLLLLFLFVMIVRAVLDFWNSLSSRPPLPGTARDRATELTHRLTEPVLAPVRKVIPPVRLGTVALDLSFYAVFLAVILLRELLAIL
jgi:YggT family protein